jgi:hypothetical protein
VANRRITEFPAINGLDINEQDLLTLVHVFEVDPTLRNKKITFEQFKDYLNVYYTSTSGATFSGNVAISGNLTVSGLGSFGTIFSSGLSTFSGIVVQNNAIVSGTVSGLTITGTNLQGVNVNATNVTTTTATGTTALFTSGQYQSLSGATITGGQGSFTSGTFVNLSGTTITGTTVAATTGTFQTLSTPVLNVSGNLSVASGLTVTGTAQFTAGVQVTGTLSGTTVTGTTARFSTVSGVSGVFTTNLSGATITGDTVLVSNVTGVSGVFTTRVSGATVTGNTGAFGNVSGISGVFTQVLSGQTITGNVGNFGTVTGVSGVFTNVSGATVTGTVVNAGTVTSVTGNFGRVSGTTVTGNAGQFTTVTGATVIGTTSVSGATVTGNAGQFTTVTGITVVGTTSISGATVTGNTVLATNLTGQVGTFTTSISGATITGNTISSTSGIFQNISGTVITGNTVQAGVISAVSGVFANIVFVNTVVSGNLSVLGTGIFSTGGIISSGTISGSTVTAPSGIFTYLSGTTVTGTTANFASGNFTNISGGVYTITSGVFASGTAANPSISFTGDSNTGIYASAADQVSITTSGTERLRVDAAGQIEAVSLGSASAPTYSFTTDPNTGIYSPGADQLAISTGGTQRIHIEADGDINIDSGGVFYDATNNRLAIGTTSPGAALHVQSAVPQVFLSNSASTAADKFAHICGLQRANDAEPEGFSIIGAGGTSTENTVYIGGFFGEANASTSVQFFTAANNTTRAGTERARIDSSGRLLVGTSTSRSLGSERLVQIEGISATTTNLSVTRNSSDEFGPFVNLGKSRSASNGGVAIVQSNDTIGSLNFYGADGVNLNAVGASISAQVDGTPGANDMPGRLVFSTTADGASSPTERLRIDSAGQIEANSLGTAAAPVWTFLSDPNTGIYSPGADQLALATGGTERLRIDASGQVNSNASFVAVASTYALRASNGSGSGQTSIGLNRAGGPTDQKNWEILHGSGGDFIIRTINDAYSGSQNAITVVRASGFGVDNIQLSTTGSERARIDSSGRLLVGTSTVYGISGLSNPDVQLSKANQDSTLAVTAWKGDAIGFNPTLQLMRSYNNTTGTHTAVPDGARLGSISFAGSDGSAFSAGAAIVANADGQTWASGDCPGRLSFQTTSDGGSSPSTRLTIDSSGRLLVGTSSAYEVTSGFSGTRQQIVANDAASFLRYSADNSPETLWLCKSRNATAGLHTVLQSGDGIARFNFQGSDGTNFVSAARIDAEVDGTPGTNDMPGRLVFSTTADGASSTTERMRITSAGNVGIGTSGPGAKLQVATGTNNYTSTANTLGVVGPDSTGLYIGTHYDGSGAGADIVSRGYSATMGDFRFIAANGPYASFATRMVIDGSGRVGIGTTSPATDLHVANAAGARIRVGGAAGAGIEFNGADTRIDIPAANTLAAYTNSTERVRIDSSGRLLVGTSTAYSVPTGDGGIRSPGLQRASTTFADSSISSTLFNTATEGGGTLTLSRSNTTTLGAQAIAASQDATGSIWFSASDGVTQIPTASIVSRVDGTPGANDMPGRLLFSTTADGASSPTERMRISNAGTTTLTSAASTAPFIANISASEVARIDSSGRLLVGTSTAVATQGVTSQVQNHGISAGQGGGSISNSYWQANNTGPAILLNKSRANTVGTYTIVQDGDVTGSILFGGSDGTAFVRNASIDAQVDGTPGANDMPGRIVLSTTADGASSPTERLRINSTGQVLVNSVGSASAPVITKLDDTNTGIFFPAADTIAFAEGGIEAARMDSSGRLLVGTTIARANFYNGANTAQIQLEGTNFQNAAFAIVCNANSDDKGSLILAKNRGTIVNSNTIVQDGDDLGSIEFQGSDGTEFVQAASVKAEVDGTPGANDMPGRIVLLTTSDGASSPTERLRVTSAGYVRLSASSPGIQFNGDTAAANALDDYEEGTWTPVYTSSNGDTVAVHHKQVGAYTKIGRYVFIELSIGASLTTVGTGDIWITGLPFTPALTDELPCIKSLVYNQYGAAFWGTMPGQAAIDKSNARLALFDVTMTSITYLTTAAFKTGTNNANNRVHTALWYKV